MQAQEEIKHESYRRQYYERTQLPHFQFGIEGFLLFGDRNIISGEGFLFLFLQQYQYADRQQGGNTEIQQEQRQIETAVHGIEYKAAENYYDGYAVTHSSDFLRKPVQFFRQRSRIAFLHLRSLEHLSAFGFIADTYDPCRAISFGNRSSFKHVIRRICGFLVELGGIGCFGANGFASQRRFVYTEVFGLQQFAIGGNFLARFQNHYVADNYVLAGDFHVVAVTNDFDTCLVIDFVEALECLLVVEFEHEADHGRQQHRNQDADRLEENMRTFTSPSELVNRNAY